MTLSKQMRPELSLTTQNGIIHFLIASPQARFVRSTHPLLPPPADLISKGFTSCCLPCLTFGKTQARVQDPTLQNYSSINSEVGAPKIMQWLTRLTLACSAPFSPFSPSDTANGLFKRSGGVKCARSMELRVPVLETAVSPSGVDAVH
jgi:hypothetical protein